MYVLTMQVYIIKDSIIFNESRESERNRVRQLQNIILLVCLEKKSNYTTASVTFTTIVKYSKIKKQLYNKLWDCIISMIKTVI